MKICILDYAVGNIHSLKRLFAVLGYETIVSNRRIDLESSDILLLPGVGAYGHVISYLQEINLYDALFELISDGKPTIGICLGMQLLFESSSEGGESGGFGFLRGDVVHLASAGVEVNIPHIGWSRVECDGLVGYGYFAHSYYAQGIEPSILSSAVDYCGIEIPAIVMKNHILGFQFHPEVSSEFGISCMEKMVNALLTTATELVN